MTALRLPAAALALAGLCACARTEPPLLTSVRGAVEMRAMETRVIPSPDRAQVLRTVIATLQDLGYNIDRIRGATGTVTATKLSVLRLSAAVSPHGPGQVAVRADAEIQVRGRFHQVDDPAFYQQDLFDPLARALSLQTLPPLDQNDAAPVPEPEPLYSKPKA